MVGSSLWLRPVRAGATAEEGVAAEHRTGVHVVEAAAAGGVSGGVQHVELVAGDVDRLPGRQRTVGRVVGPDHVPQHPVGVVQHDRSVDDFAQRHSGVDVVVVAVGEHDGFHAASVDRSDDRFVVVGGIEDDDLAVVTDDPDVVGDLPFAAVEGEDPVGRDQFDAHRSEHHDAAEHLASLHLVERLLDRIEFDGLRHEAVEVEPPLEVEVDQHREVATEGSRRTTMT